MSEQPREIITEVSGFYPVFEVVLRDTNDILTAAVHGVMWRFCQMRDGVCKAKLETIAGILGISTATVMRRQALLVPTYFIDMTPDLKNKPHVFRDTGAVALKSQLTASSHFTEKRDISQRNVRLAESQLNKALNKDSNKDNNNVVVISKLYEQNIGLIHNELLKDELVEYSELPIEWLEKAFKIAADNNVRKWSYVRSILNDWRDAGKITMKQEQEPEEEKPIEYVRYDPEEEKKYVPPPSKRPKIDVHKTF